MRDSNEYFHGGFGHIRCDRRLLRYDRRSNLPKNFCSLTGLSTQEPPNIYRWNLNTEYISLEYYYRIYIVGISIPNIVRILISNIVRILVQHIVRILIPNIVFPRSCFMRYQVQSIYFPIQGYNLKKPLMNYLKIKNHYFVLKMELTTYSPDSGR